MANAKSVTPAPPAPKSVAVRVPLADVMIQAPVVLDTPPIPGPIVAALSRARDLAGVADMLIDALNAGTGTDRRMGDALVVVREGFLELGLRARAVAGRTNTYSIVAEGVR